MNEFVVLSVGRYDEMLLNEQNYQEINKQLYETQNKVNKGDLLAVKCATDLYKLETQDIEQSLHLESDAWSVISSEKLKMLRDAGIEDDTIKRFLKRMHSQLKEHGHVL